MPATATPTLTFDDLLALPNADKFERWLINGELREEPMSLRSPDHAEAVACVSFQLKQWALALQPRPRCFAGDIDFRLRADPETNVGIDVALATPAQTAAREPDARMLDGPPLLAVEVLSKSDTLDRIDEKLDAYLNAGTPMAWLVDPHDRSVTVYRPGAEPQMFAGSQTLTADSELPGFRRRVADIFE